LIIFVLSYYLSVPPNIFYYYSVPQVQKGWETLHHKQILYVGAKAAHKNYDEIEPSVSLHRGVLVVHYLNLCHNNWSSNDGSSAFFTSSNIETTILSTFLFSHPLPLLLTLINAFWFVNTVKLGYVLITNKKKCQFFVRNFLFSKIYYLSWFKHQSNNENYVKIYNL